jgi:pantetheine-phosphate adenylyltransferase
LNLAVYPGTFDPVTYGHLDVIERGLKTFEKLVEAVAANPPKPTLFDLDERMDMLRELVGDRPRLSVESYSGLTVDCVRRLGGRVILRGIRTVSDFEFEFQMALTNRVVAPDIETVFVMPSQDTSFLSSRLVKEVAGLGGDASKFVPELVARRLEQRLSETG